MNGFIDKKGFIHCPICGNKTKTKVLSKTSLKKFPLFCPKCKKETIIDMEKNKMIIAEPDATTQSR